MSAGVNEGSYCRSLDSRECKWARSSSSSEDAAVVFCKNRWMRDDFPIKKESHNFSIHGPVIVVGAKGVL